MNTPDLAPETQTSPKPTGAVLRQEVQGEVRYWRVLSYSIVLYLLVPCDADGVVPPGYSVYFARAPVVEDWRMVGWVDR